MTTSIDATPAPASTSGFARLGGLLSAPVRTMEDIGLRPTVLFPLLLIIGGVFLSFLLVSPKVDDSQMIQDMMAERGVSAEQIQTQLDAADKMKGFAPYTNTVSTLIFTLLLPAAIFWVALMAFGGQARFKQVFAVTAWSFMPVLVRFLLMPLVLMRRSSYSSMEMQTSVRSNLGFLADMKENPVLFSVLAAVDLFMILTMVLAVIGLAAAAKISRGKAAILVVILYLLSIGLSAGMVSLFS